MASPFQSSKKSVDLAAPVVRVSRIRRDPPPPPVKEVSSAEIKERDAWTVVIGIATFALALVVIVVGVSNAAGWSPRDYTIHIESGDRR